MGGWLVPSSFNREITRPSNTPEKPNKEQYPEERALIRVYTYMYIYIKEKKYIYKAREGSKRTGQPVDELASTFFLLFIHANPLVDPCSLRLLDDTHGTTFSTISRLLFLFLCSSFRGTRPSSTRSPVGCLFLRRCPLRAEREPVDRRENVRSVSRTRWKFFGGKQMESAGR